MVWPVGRADSGQNKNSTKKVVQKRMNKILKTTLLVQTAQKPDLVPAKTSTEVDHRPHQAPITRSLRVAQHLHSYYDGQSDIGPYLRVIQMSTHLVPPSRPDVYPLILLWHNRVQNRQ